MTQLQPTVLDFRQVKENVDSVANELELLPPKAFIALTLRRYFNLTDEEIDQAILDGSNDYGIDAAFVIEGEGDGRPQAVVLQSKYTDLESKMENRFPGADFQKICNAITDLLLRPPSDKSYVNSKVGNFSRDFHSLKNPEILIVPLSNNLGLHADSIEFFEDFVSRNNAGGDFIRLHEINLVTLAKALAPAKSRTITSTLKLEGKYFTFATGSAKTVVGKISGSRIAQLRDEEGEDLFDQNVRGFKGLNDVNKAIRETAESEETGPLFFYLNNGITIICKKMKWLDKEESPEIEVEDLQIVNGGQTTRTLWRAYQSGKLNKNVSLLIKIIETDEEKLLDNVTEATNTQNPVSSRDLRSNDYIQKQIEDVFKQKNYYYEARKDKYKDKPRAKRVDAEKATQAYHAYANKQPAEAKNKKRHLFGSLYNDIFNDGLDFDMFLFSYLLLRKVEELNKAYRSKEGYSFASYSTLHTVSCMKELGIEKRSQLDDSAIIKAHEKVMESTKKVVDEALLDKGDNYSHRAMFIDPPTLGKIEEALRA